MWSGTLTFSSNVTTSGSLLSPSYIDKVPGWQADENQTATGPSTIAGYFRTIDGKTQLLMIEVKDETLDQYYHDHPDATETDPLTLPYPYTFTFNASLTNPF